MFKKTTDYLFHVTMADKNGEIYEADVVTDNVFKIEVQAKMMGFDLITAVLIKKIETKKANKLYKRFRKEGVLYGENLYD